MYTEKYINEILSLRTDYTSQHYILTYIAIYLHDRDHVPPVAHTVEIYIATLIDWDSVMYVSTSNYALSFSAKVMDRLDIDYKIRKWYKMYAHTCMDYNDRNFDNVKKTCG